MPLYFGEFESECRDGRILISSSLQDPEYDFRGSPMILLPQDRRILAYNGSHYVRVLQSISSWDNDDFWTERGLSAEVFAKMVEANSAPPDYVDELAYAKSRSALALLRSKSLQDISRLSSPSLKKFIRDSLAACGIDAQMRVRVPGGEIDLLLPTVGK